MKSMAPIGVMSMEREKRKKSLWRGGHQIAACKRARRESDHVQQGDSRCNCQGNGHEEKGYSVKPP